MSEVKTGYMAELDAWSDKTIIEPLADAYLRGPEEASLARRNLRAKRFAKKFSNRIATAKMLARARPLRRSAHGEHSRGSDSEKEQA